MSPLDIVNPCCLFDNRNLKSSYRTLIKAYHPDKNSNPEAVDESKHITTCYKLLEPLGNRVVGLKQISKLEVGTVYCYNDHIVFHAPGFEREAAKYLTMFKYANKDMEDQFRWTKLNVTVEKDIVTILDTSKEILDAEHGEIFPMRNLLTVYHPIDVKHVAWMMSRLISNACFFQYNGYSHGGVTIENCYVDPLNHGVYTYGGWWYLNKLYTPLKVISLNVFKQLDKDIQDEQVSSPKIDLISIKNIGITLLGGGMKSSLTARVPKPILDWMFAPVAKNAFEEFTNWGNVIKSAYGERVFIEFAVDSFKTWNIK